MQRLESTVNGRSGGGSLAIALLIDRGADVDFRPGACSENGHRDLDVDEQARPTNIGSWTRRRPNKATLNRPEREYGIGGRPTQNSLSFFALTRLAHPNPSFLFRTRRRQTLKNVNFVTIFVNNDSNAVILELHLPAVLATLTHAYLRPIDSNKDKEIAFSGHGELCLP